MSLTLALAGKTATQGGLNLPELRKIADELGLRLPKSATRAHLVAALSLETSASERPAPTPSVQLTLKRPAPTPSVPKRPKITRPKIAPSVQLTLKRPAPASSVPKRPKITRPKIAPSVPLTLKRPKITRPKIAPSVPLTLKRPTPAPSVPKRPKITRPKIAPSASLALKRPKIKPTPAPSVPLTLKRPKIKPTPAPSGTLAAERPKAKPVAAHKPVKWTSQNSCRYLLGSDLTSHDRAVAFDFDDTLAPLHQSAPLPGRDELLTRLAESYTILIFSNQKGIEIKKTTDSLVQTRFQTWLSCLEPEVSARIAIFYASSDDQYRKPATGMLQLALELGLPRPIWFCGDAAGRKGDFSQSDLYFAHNAGLVFQTPEQVFDGRAGGDEGWAVKTKAIYKLDRWREGRLVNPRLLIELDSPDQVYRRLQPSLAKPFVLVLVGPQGSGKSTLAKYVAAQTGALVINRDTLKTKPRMERAFNQALGAGQSVIIDNTNGTKADRELWIVPRPWTRQVVVFTLPKEQVFHLTRHRLAQGGPKIPTVAIHTFYKRFEPVSEPDLELTKAVVDPERQNGVQLGRYTWR